MNEELKYLWLITCALRDGNRNFADALIKLYKRDYPPCQKNTKPC